MRAEGGKRLSQSYCGSLLIAGIKDRRPFSGGLLKRSQFNRNGRTGEIV